MNRQQMLERLRACATPWDMVVIGGGATGIGVAIDAASRGYSVALLERDDFGKGTSSRSTKLVHGGVRYLEQGNISLVMEALKERGLLRQNAPHLVSDLEFVVPNYDWWEAPFYGLGLKLYNVLAGKYGFGDSRILSREETLRRIPTLRQDGLRGGVVYYDGQFDDARLLIHMAATAAEQGAVLVNYCPVTDLTAGPEGYLEGVTATDTETGETLRLDAKVVINATGPFTDSVRRLQPGAVKPLLATSQGIHLVFDGTFLSADSAIMVPQTSDGRVLFAIPWHGHTVVGTTDTPIAEPTPEPAAFESEIEFILSTAGEYLSHAPRRSDVLSVFAGIRPLVRSGEGGSTAALSRDHTILFDPSGLLTITGGKWTTYRHMAEDCVNQAAMLARLPERDCVTRTLNIHGYHQHAGRFGHLWVHGSDAPHVAELGDRPLSRRLPYTDGEIRWAAREEMARTVEDVLSRRTRALFLDVRAALEMAPAAADILAQELGRSGGWAASQVEQFTRLAAGWLPPEA
jgi:glycerol-3-phosphate dehydrogenase